MARRTIISGGRVVDPAQGVDRPMTVLVEDGRFAGLLRPGHPGARPGRGDRQVDATGLWVLPGLIDIHVHLREPGMTRAENVASGTAAAAAGGFTTVVCMPNTRPVLDEPKALRRLGRSIDKNALVRVVPAAALSLGLAGQSVSDLAALVEAGAGALSDDGLGTGRSVVLAAALEGGRRLGRTVLVHAEDKRLSAGGVMRAGPVARRLGLPGISSSSETVRVQRDLRIQARVGGRLHFQHVSTVGALRAIRRAKARGQSVSCEATPHHLFLCDEDVAAACGRRGPDAHFKMNPPLGRPIEREALRRALGQGWIDAIATDHAPHLAQAKARGFLEAPFGITGLETALALTLRLVAEGVLDLSTAIGLLTRGPASVIGLDAGGMKRGQAADLCLVDPEAIWRVDARRMVSRAHNTPFDGWELKGRVVSTWLGGKPVFTLKGSGT